MAEERQPRIRFGRALLLAGLGTLLLVGGSMAYRSWSSARRLAERIAELDARVGAQTAALLRDLQSATILVDKQARVLVVHDQDGVPRWRRPLTAFSGRLGPKRAEGDLQIPEGVYRPTLLNPDSNFHLSIRLDYPNGLDRRFNGPDCGSDIYIHGGEATIGCVAIGDPAIEELFHLVHALGLERVRVLIVPNRRLDAGGQTDAYQRAVYESLRPLLADLDE